MVLAPFLFKEKVSRSKIVGFAAVLCGVFLVNGQAAARGKTVWGLVCGGLSAVMYAFMVIFNKKSKNITGLQNSMLQLFVSFLTVAVFVGFKRKFVIHIPADDWIPILILGLVNTGAGCYFYFSSIGRLPVQTVAICGYIEPLSAVVLSVAFLGEPMSPLQMLGAVLILGGAIFGESVKPKTAQGSAPG
jgi:drug/metabolite transporter (DMT)-like permease